MPYVPCPLNATTWESLTATSKWEWWTKDGEYYVGTERTAPYAYTYAAKYGSGGPKVPLQKGLWAPVRDYQRSASICEYRPGLSQYVSSNNGRLTWHGYPWPSSIWSPTDNMLFHATSDDFFVDPKNIPRMSSNIRARLITELLVKAGRRQVNFGEALGESKSTVKMLAQSASTLARAVLAARKGRFGQVAKILRRPRISFPRGKTVADKWLAYHYGWKPLMSDIYDSYNFLKKGFDTRPQVLSVSRRISRAERTTFQAPFFDVGEVRSEVQFTGKLYYRTADNWLSGLNQIGLINPVEVAWALVPFSFVIDWLIPVGSYLEALSARMGITFIDGFLGTRISSLARKSGLKMDVGSWKAAGSTLSVTVDTKGYNREKLYSAVPALYWKNPFSTSHVANAIALITSLRR